MYRTRDRVRYDEQGKLEFLGRSDHLVKVRGYRIELGEIEAVLSRHPLVVQSVVVLRGEEAQEKRIVAYVVVDKEERNAESNPSKLRSYLKGLLPDYMIPTHFVLLDALPLTPNGKVDRHALPSPGKEREESADSYVAPRDATEKALVAIWADLLKLEQVGIFDNFFDLGGHSLLVTQVIARLRKLVGVEVSIQMFFEVPTIAGLAARLQQGVQEISAPELVPTSRDQELPLSFAQQRLWFLHQLDPRSAAYNVPAAVRLQGHLNIAALHYSFLTLVQRHESLRTTFRELNDRVVQQISKVTTLPFPMIDLSGCLAQQREEEMQRLTQQEAQYPFDLLHGSLCRVLLLRLDSTDHVFLLTMHHIVTDGWSMTILVEELATLYRANIVREPSPLPPLPIQYADYALWQRRWLQGEVLKGLLRYWTQQLSEARAVELPTDYPRTAMLSPHGGQTNLQLRTEIVQKLRELSRQENVTLFMTLLCAFQVLLSRLSGEEDIVVGIDSANRSRLETERIVGFFINILALRTYVIGRLPFRNLLREVREAVLGAYMHQELPFETVVEHLRLEREGNRTPLVNVLFVMQNMPSVQVELPDLVINSVKRNSTFAKFELALFVHEDPQSLSVAVKYSTDLFKSETIATLLQRYEALLHSIVLRPTAQVMSLGIATDNEKAQKSRKRADIHRHLKMNQEERLQISGADGNQSE